MVADAEGVVLQALRSRLRGAVQLRDGTRELAADVVAWQEAVVLRPPQARLLHAGAPQLLRGPRRVPLQVDVREEGLVLPPLQLGLLRPAARLRGAAAGRADPDHGAAPERLRGRHAAVLVRRQADALLHQLRPRLRGGRRPGPGRQRRVRLPGWPGQLRDRLVARQEGLVPRAQPVLLQADDGFAGALRLQGRGEQLAGGLVQGQAGLLLPAAPPHMRSLRVLPEVREDREEPRQRGAPLRAAPRLGAARLHLRGRPGHAGPHSQLQDGQLLQLPLLDHESAGRRRQQAHAPPEHGRGGGGRAARLQARRALLVKFTGACWGVCTRVPRGEQLRPGRERGGVIGLRGWR
mmetsp:Transcript_86861/g.281261  ORF Transcript_86861/g.281261 Transcript_86861/m.281261 type:complete len:350 (-) Transcript_86861:16-1065(-)